MRGIPTRDGGRLTVDASVPGMGISVRTEEAAEYRVFEESTA